MDSRNALRLLLNCPPALCRVSAVALSAMILTIAAPQQVSASRRLLWGLAANAPVRAAACHPRARPQPELQ